LPRILSRSHRCVNRIIAASDFHKNASLAITFNSGRMCPLVIQCPHCLGEIPEDRNVCPVCGTLVHDDDSPTMPTTPQGASVRMQATPLDRGRFVAGTVLAHRYRIIGLLGKGGMGEVYKAEDLKLHQLVALKFLPEALSSDGSMVARFHREVRTARQITHANVCRVHDIGQIAVGAHMLHFISMEYIDGEDLATLLRRIGHLPAQKGMELGRQICSGLSAAHEMGVVHRDLKPANIMLDGRGRARITDFGLSGLTDEFGRDEQSGTPAYMAPEQLKGSPATPQTDMYALGLVLYEVFTGKRPFQGRSVAELMDQHRSETPPVTRILEIDPLAEKAILRCLSREPNARPSGPLEVLSALSGGNPLDKALAAGETPSPEMVAAAGEQTGLKPFQAWACLIAILIVSVAVAGRLNPAKARNRVMDQSPEKLIEKARSIRSSLGYPEPVDSAFGCAPDQSYVDYGRQMRNPARFQAYLNQSRPGWGYCWYLESLGTLTPAPHDLSGLVFARPGSRVKEESPEVAQRTVRLKLDFQGRLVELRGSPGTVEANPSKPTKTTDWSALLQLAGIDSADLVETTPQQAAPPVAFNDRVAWTGTWPERPDIQMKVEAASFDGQPVFFIAQGPPPANSNGSEGTRTVVIIGMVIFLIGGSIFLARHNVTAGRGDQRGAFRIALFALSTLLLAWFFGTDHRLDSRELNLFLSATGEALYRSVVVGLLYLAAEPFVRQRWPHALIPWNRVLEGRFRDPLVGRAVLIGIVFAAALALLRNAGLLLEVMSPELPELDLMNAMLANTYAISFLLGLVFDSVNLPLALFFLFFFFRIVFRSRWVAGAVLIVLVNGYVNYSNPEVYGILVATAFVLLWLLGVTRFGLIAGMSLWFADRIFRAWSMLAPAPWYQGRMYLLLSAVLILSAYSFVRSLGNRPLVPVDLFVESNGRENT
jgi:serine/threonine-protein kinase